MGSGCHPKRWQGAAVMAADFYFRLGMREVWSQLLGRYKIRKILLTKIIQGFLVPKIVYSKDRF